MKTEPFHPRHLDEIPEFNEAREQSNRIALLLHGRFNQFSGTRAYYGFIDQQRDEGLLVGYMHVSEDADGESEAGGISVREILSCSLVKVDLEGIDLTFQDVASWDYSSDEEIDAFLESAQGLKGRAAEDL